MSAIVVWLSFSAAAVGGFLLGCVFCWSNYRRHWTALDARAAVLDQHAELLDMRAEDLPGPAEVTDSGFPVKQRPSDLPPRNVGVTAVQESMFDPTAARQNARESAYLTPQMRAAAIVVIGPSEPLGPIMSYLVEPLRRLGDRLSAWLIGLPEPALTVLALVLAYWPRQDEPARPLDAPMAYVPPAPYIGRAPAPSTASNLILRLRAERGAVVAPLAGPGGRHAVNAVPGAPTQRDRSTADEQRYAARTARAMAGGPARIFDTAETVTVPALWYRTPTREEIS
jgi:hypothetical protein